MDEADSAPKGQGRTILLDAEENSYCLVDDEQFVVKAFRLFHRIPSFGFSVVEKKRAGKLNAQKLRDLGKHSPLPDPTGATQGVGGACFLRS